MFHQLPKTSSQLQEEDGQVEKCQIKELIGMVDNLKVNDKQESAKEDSPG